MTAPLHWVASQAPRFHNYRAATEAGVLCLDHPDARGRVGVRYIPHRPAALDLATCVTRAVGPSRSPAERWENRAYLGLLPRQGWFADAALAQRAIGAALAPNPVCRAAAALCELGFRPWPKPDRAGSVRGYRWRGPKGARILILVGRDVVELRHRPAGSRRRRVLMRLRWRAVDADGSPQDFPWPDALHDPRAGLVMAGALAAAIQNGEIA